MVRVALFFCGFGIWAIGSLLAAGPHGIREAWDQPGYWMIGAPLLLLAQAAAAPRLKERPALQPLWVIAGHMTAMILIHPAGTDLGLLPLSLLFLGLPAYGALYLAGMLGRALFARPASDA